MSALRRPSALYREHAQKPEWKFLRKIRGVIHVGANVGQERSLYDAFGLKVLWIEPIPSVFEQLVANIRSYPNQRAANYLIVAEDGKEYELHISNNAGESSSILRLAKHSEMWPEVAYTASIRIPGVTLGTALREQSVPPSEYDALVLDTQGTEYRILEGASALLPLFRYVKVEAPDFKSYEGCCQIEQLTAFMNTHGFMEEVRCAFSYREGVGTYFDVIYRRR
jgi:FkbM family methyltransferase